MPEDGADIDARALGGTEPEADGLHIHVHQRRDRAYYVRGVRRRKSTERRGVT